MVFDKIMVVCNKIVLSYDTVQLCSATYCKNRTGQQILQQLCGLYQKGPKLRIGKVSTIGYCNFFQYKKTCYVLKCLCTVKGLSDLK